MNEYQDNKVEKQRKKEKENKNVKDQTIPTFQFSFTFLFFLLFDRRTACKTNRWCKEGQIKTSIISMGKWIQTHIDR